VAWGHILGRAGRFRSGRNIAAKLAARNLKRQRRSAKERDTDGQGDEGGEPSEHSARDPDANRRDVKGCGGRRRHGR